MSSRKRPSTGFFITGIIAALLIALLVLRPWEKGNLRSDRSGIIELRGGTELYYKVVADNLFVPWEILWGPDDLIWFTERNGYLKKLNPETGEVKQLLHLPDTYEWTSSGTLGMALYESPTDQTYVYLVYTYSTTGKPDDIYERCVRYPWDQDRDSLGSAEIILDSLHCGPSGTFGSRLMFTPDGKLLMTTGCDAYDIIDRRLHGGMTIRINPDGTIPKDNPIPNSYIYTYGHRNHQGLTMGRNGLVYFSEHGPTSDDEINILTPGGDYGWPHVWGICDKEIEEHFCDSANVIEPIRHWTPTIAPCGLIYYDHSYISEWRNSLLLATLRDADMRVLKLSQDGLRIKSETIYLDEKIGRIRDFCIAPDGRIFLSTSHFEREVADLNIEPGTTSYDKIFEIGVRRR